MALTSLPTHVAEEGDTLRSVAIAHGLQEDDLARLNDIEIGSDLIAGEKVVLGYVTKRIGIVSAKAFNEALKSKKATFNETLLAVQHELASVGVLHGSGVTGKPNPETKAAVRLWKQALNSLADDTLDFHSLTDLARRRSRFIVALDD